MWFGSDWPTLHRDFFVCKINILHVILSMISFVWYCRLSFSVFCRKYLFYIYLLWIQVLRKQTPNHNKLFTAWFSLQQYENELSVHTKHGLLSISMPVRPLNVNDYILKIDHSTLFSVSMMVWFNPTDVIVYEFQNGNWAFLFQCMKLVNLHQWKRNFIFKRDLCHCHNLMQFA